MFVNILNVLLMVPVVMGENNLTTTCTHENSIYECEVLYKKNIIDKIDIEYITLKQLKSRIRLYNYNIYMFYALRNKNKRDRRRIRRDFYKANNYNTNSNSKELEYLEEICKINYDKIDKSTLETIKFKNDKIKILIDNKRANNSFNNVCIIILTIAFFFMITIMICG